MVYTLKVQLYAREKLMLFYKSGCSKNLVK